MAREEKFAPEVCVTKDDTKDNPEILREFNRPMIAPKINKLSLFVTLASLAALFFVIAYLQLAPQFTTVATVKECLNIQFADDKGIATGSQLTNHRESYRLKRGILEIEFEYGATVIIEAPAEFKLDSADKMTLNSGRLYAKVPGSAAGFIVETPYSTIIDLGTEFGVKVDDDGTTDVHMIRGRASLVPGSNGNKSESCDLVAGDAKSVNISGQVRKIKFQKAAFVREASSQIDFIWRGETLNLADVVNGGNGFGTGRQGTCIDPTTGNVSPVDSIATGSSWDKKQSYLRAVRDLPYVDCVIVPSKDGGDLPLTTTGVSLPDFHALMGTLRWPVQTQTYEKKYPLLLNGQAYGLNERAGILIHANCGITFDLDKIRQNMPVDLVSFKTLCGINESKIANDLRAEKTADIYVFLDGRQVFYKSFPHVLNNAFPIQIDFQEKKPRFLTLLVCCGEYGNDFDWCVFGTPELLFESH